MVRFNSSSGAQLCLSWVDRKYRNREVSVRQFMVNHNSDASKILDGLHKKYFQRGSFSEMTSSHWKKYGALQEAAKVGGKWELSGIGFGDHAPKKWWRHIYYLPTSVFLLFLLRSSDRRIVGIARSLAEKVGRMFSYDVARMILSCELIIRNTSGLDGITIAIIGDGYGFLGGLLKAINPSVRIIFINLGRTLLFDVFYSFLAYPRCGHKLIVGHDNSPPVDFTYIEAELVNEIKVCADLFINIASMQEMDAEAIATYFRIIRSQSHTTLFYCCNRTQKSLPDGSVTKFSEYGWLDSDEVIIDELCPWHQIAPMNRPPFIYKFDGPIQHRLVKIRSGREANIV